MIFAPVTQFPWKGPSSGIVKIHKDLLMPLLWSHCNPQQPPAAALIANIIHSHLHPLIAVLSIITSLLLVFLMTRNEGFYGSNTFYT